MKPILFFAFLFVFITIRSEDFIYSITAMDDSEIVYPDSILCNNLTSGSFIIFKELPKNNQYALNLSSQKLEIGANVEVQQSYSEFEIKENIPGRLCVSYMGTSNKTMTLHVYDLAGKVIATKTISILSQGGGFSLLVPKNQVYIIHMKTFMEYYTIKVMGNINISEFAIIPEYRGTQSKSVNVAVEQGFDIQTGDSLSFLAYYMGEASDPVFIKAGEVKTLDFYFYSTTGEVEDRDGNTYKTVRIGDQWWMAENLRSSKYSNGISIPLVNNTTNWGKLSDNNVDKAYCWFNDDESNTIPYGALYTFAASTNGLIYSEMSIQGICPDGWHIPSKAEWETLAETLGGKTLAGGKLKEVGTVHWDLPNTGASNSSGFSGIPSGSRAFSDGLFYGTLSTYAAYWSSSQYNSTLSWAYYLSNLDAQLIDSATNKSNGHAVRCLKNK